MRFICKCSPYLDRYRFGTVHERFFEAPRDCKLLDDTNIRGIGTPDGRFGYYYDKPLDLTYLLSIVQLTSSAPSCDNVLIAFDAQEIKYVR